MRHSQLIAQRPLPKSHPRNRPSGATAKDARAPLPGWAWLVAGLGAGILITSLVKLSSSHPAQTSQPLAATEQPAPPPVQTPPTKPEPEKPAQKANAATAQTEDKPATQFDFYTLLPEQEVIEPNERNEQSHVRSAKESKDAKSPAAVTATTGSAGTTTSNDAAPGEEFILQAGSFRSAQEAERRRAQVQTLGLPTRQESVSANGDTWYRVLVGPFSSRDAVTAARDKLAAQHIETIMVRKKTAG